MLKPIEYSPFRSFCLRTPILPLSFLVELLKDKEVTDIQLRKAWNRAHVQEAIYLASPELYGEITKWFDEKVESPLKKKRLRYTLLKYLSRMASRCTPFGLFAGITTGSWQKETSIVLNTSKDISISRLDMHFLMGLVHKLEKDPQIKAQIKWYSNSTLYKLGAHFRYVKYSYKAGKRHHTIEAIRSTSVIEQVVQAAALGKSIAELISVIRSPDILEEEAESFVSELIELQLLVSELEPALTGDRLLSQLNQTLKRLNIVRTEIETLSLLLDELNKTMLKKEQKPIWDKLLSSGQSLYPDLDKKFLIQTDLFRTPLTSTLNSKWIQKIKEVIPLLQQVTSYKESPTITKFKEAFLSRYETQEVPLLSVLDVETGIGYGNTNEHAYHPILHDLKQQNTKTNEPSITIRKQFSFLNRKLQQVLRERSTVLELLDSDLASLPQDEDRYPDTFAAMAELMELDGEERMYLHAVSGPTAIRLLARFGHGDSGIYQLIENIAHFEEELHPNKILAEIIHLPENRVGNVLQRPIIRTFEIPYLGKAAVEREHQIPVNDLFISVKNNKIILRSKKFDKEVIPYLSNSHNFRNQTTPVYHFLSEIASQDKQSGLSFNWNGLENIHEFIPRVVYKGVILSKAKWTIYTEDIQPFFREITESEFDALKNDWITKYSLPQWVQWVKGDNTLTCNLNNLSSVKMLLHSVKSKKSFVLEEFLFYEENRVKDTENNYYCNQFVIPFYKSEI